MLIGPGIVLNAPAQINFVHCKGLQRKQKINLTSMKTPFPLSAYIFKKNFLDVLNLLTTSLIGTLLVEYQPSFFSMFVIGLCVFF